MSNKLIDSLNANKINTLIYISWCVLIVLWVTSNQAVVVVTNNKVFDFIDSSILLSKTLNFILYSSQCLITYYAILQKPIFKENAVIVSITIVFIWVLKTFIFKSPLLDLLCIIPLSIILKNKWKRSIVGCWLVIVFTIMTVRIKGIDITTVNFNSFDMLRLSIDYYLLSLFYYLKEVVFSKQNIVVEKYNFFLLKNKEFWHSTFFILLIYAAVLFVSIFLNKEKEALIIVASFFILKRKDSKIFYLENFNFYFIIVVSFSAAVKLSTQIELSMIFPMCLGYFLTTLFHYIKVFLELKEIKSSYIEYMTFEELKNKYPNEENLKLIYDYLHTNKNKEIFAYERGYSVRTIQRMIKKLKEKRE